MKSKRTITKTSSSMNNNGKLVVAVLIGAAAGAALGLLFAPDKGSEVRRKIMDSAGDLADSIKERAAQGIDALTGSDYASSGNGNSDMGSYQASKKGQRI